MAGLLDLPGRVTQRQKAVQLTPARYAITDHVKSKGSQVKAWPSFYPYVLYNEAPSDQGWDAVHAHVEIRYPSVWNFRGDVRAGDAHTKVADGTVVTVDKAWIDRRRAEGGYPTVDLFFMRNSACFIEPRSPLAVGGRLPQPIADLLNSPTAGATTTPVTSVQTTSGSPPPTASGGVSAASSPSTSPRSTITGPGDPNRPAVQEGSGRGGPVLRLESRGGRRFRFGR